MARCRTSLPPGSPEHVPVALACLGAGPSGRLRLRWRELVLVIEYRVYCQSSSAVFRASRPSMYPQTSSKDTQLRINGWFEAIGCEHRERGGAYLAPGRGKMLTCGPMSRC